MKKFRKCKIRKVRELRKLRKLKKDNNRSSAKVAGKGNRHQVKQQLFDDYGYTCWLCEKELPREKLTLHHIHQFCYTHSTTYEDSMILCCDCHFGVVNRIKYDSEEYWALMNKIIAKKR